MTIMWVSCGGHVGVMWESYGDHVGIIWGSFGNHMGVMWGSFNDQKISNIIHRKVYVRSMSFGKRSVWHDSMWYWKEMTLFHSSIQHTTHYTFRSTYISKQTSVKNDNLRLRPHFVVGNESFISCHYFSFFYHMFASDCKAEFKF